MRILQCEFAAETTLVTQSHVHRRTSSLPDVWPQRSFLAELTPRTLDTKCVSSSAVRVEGGFDRHVSWLCVASGLSVGPEYRPEPTLTLGPPRTLMFVVSRNREKLKHGAVTRLSRIMSFIMSCVSAIFSMTCALYHGCCSVYVYKSTLVDMFF